MQLFLSPTWAVNYAINETGDNSASCCTTCLPHTCIGVSNPFMMASKQRLINVIQYHKRLNVIPYPILGMLAINTKYFDTVISSACP